MSKIKDYIEEERIKREQELFTEDTYEMGDEKDYERDLTEDYENSLYQSVDNR